MDAMRVLVADSQSRVRFALGVLLRRYPEAEVVGEAVDAVALLDQVRGACPDVVLLGWELPGLAEAGGLAALRQAHPSVAVIGLSARPEAGRAALEAGVDAFVSKVDPPEKLIAAIDRCCPAASSRR
jgi:DNA-binding NarL/FixJ family response regulator